VNVSRRRAGTTIFEKYWIRKMEQGTIKRITDKGFGFISTSNADKDMFFHSSSVEGIHFNDLREGQEVTFNVGQGPKGPRAENVQLVEN
jgi:CspA family cold shock protein